MVNMYVGWMNIFRLHISSDLIWLFWILKINCILLIFQNASLSPIAGAWDQWPQHNSHMLQCIYGILPLFSHTGLAQKSKQYKKRKTLHLNFFRCQLCISHLPQSCSSTWYPRPGTIETNYWIFTFFVSNLSFFQMYAVCDGIYEYRFPCCCLTHIDKHEWIQLMCLWGRLFLTDINLWTPLMSVFRIAQETYVNIKYLWI